MLLVIDVGNTHTVLGIYQDEHLLKHWRISTKLNRTVDEYGVFLRNLFLHNDLDYHEIKDIVVSSVVPPLILTLEGIARRYFELEPLIIGPGVKTGMPLLYDNPREIGADRIVNAVAGYELYGGPLLIVDFGTATTFCVISKKGEYLGGAITVGLDVAMEALFQKTAKLPRIELKKPFKVIGRNTEASMQSGLYYGFVGQVEGIVRRIKEEMGEDLFVVVTGGMSKFIVSESAIIDKVDPFLTLEGLKIIYKRNRA
ncbi:MAG: type III pantothenate kinase [Clostridia bacterium]|nr:type III pantothenate kinase [Clostridia bacterium]MDD4666104.1 type III pantothenate kinase [Clostridia bacterium]